MINSKITFLFCLMFPLVLKAKVTNKYGFPLDTGKLMVEVIPKFIKGENCMFKILSDSLKYPKSALEDNIGGRVVTQFTVDSIGNLVNLKIISGVRDDIDMEALRLVSLLKGWIPGTQNGKNVNVVYTMPLNFFPNERFGRKFMREHYKNGKYY